jgi:hypothetical protein
MMATITIIVVIIVICAVSTQSRHIRNTIPVPLPRVNYSLSLPISNLTNRWPSNPDWNIVDDNVGNNYINVVNNTLLVTYPKRSYIPSSPVRGGFQFYAQPKIFPTREITFSYKLMIPRNFTWVKGGKLPGIWMGNMGANGGNHFQDGSSFRLMWRANGAAEAYLYIPKQSKQSFYKQPGYVYNNESGESLWRGLFKFQVNIWNTVTLVAKMNNPNKADGSISLTINNIMRKFDGFIWINSPSKQYINGLMMHTFFGGSDTSWSTPMEQSVYFKDFQVSNVA